MQYRTVSAQLPKGYKKSRPGGALLMNAPSLAVSGDIGIRDHFSLIFAPTELGLSKPDPQIFAGALAAAGCNPEEAVMVGDRLDNHIGPAKSQGWRTERVRQDFSRLQIPCSPYETPDMTISETQELSSRKQDG